MFKTKQLTTAALLCSIGAILQLLPVWFSDLFTMFTLLSSIPIYFITRKDLKLGIISYFVTSIVILFFIVQEFFIFIFLNGLVGISLGALYNYKTLRMILPGFFLSCSILFVSIVIGIPIIGAPISFNLITISLVALFSLVYCNVYSICLSFLENRMIVFKKYLKIK